MQRFNLSRLAGILFVCILLAHAQSAHAQAALSVQGSIQKSTGQAVDDGDYAITFKLYTTDAGGTALWSETQDPVQIIGGVYSVTLGSVNPLNLPFDQPYFLGIAVGTGLEHTPRTKLTATPYALALLGQDNKFPSTGLVKMESVATGQATTTATSYTVATDDHVIFLDHTANQNVTLPAATAANAGRHLMLVNKMAVAKTLTASNYENIEGATSTTIPAKSAIELQSNGSLWRQTGGYVTPTVGAKARVYCTLLTSVWNFVSGGGSVFKNLIWANEITDVGGDFDHTTGVFTAPRSGTYHLSGMFRIYQTFGAISWATSMWIYGNPSLTSPSALYSEVGSGTERTFRLEYDVVLTAGQTINPQIGITIGTGGYIYPVPEATTNWLIITER